jgi:hypothetical protein
MMIKMWRASSRMVVTRNNCKSSAGLRVLEPAAQPTQDGGVVAAEM